MDWVNMKGDPHEVIVYHYSYKVAVVKSSVHSSAEFSTISTTAVLLLSDDVVLTCNELDRDKSCLFLGLNSHVTINKHFKYGNSIQREWLDSSFITTNNKLAKNICQTSLSHHTDY